MPSQQPTALMPTPTMQPPMTTPTMGGAQSQYAPPTMPSGAGGFPQQQHQPQGAPMSAPPSSIMSAPATSLPAAPSTSLYGSGPPQQLLQPPTNAAPPVAHAGGISGVPMAMTSGMVTAGGVVAPQASTTSSTPAVAMATASGGVGMPAAGGVVNASVAGGTVSGAGGGGGSVGTPNAGAEKKKKKKKVSIHVLNLFLYPYMYKWTLVITGTLARFLIWQIGDFVENHQI